MKKSELKKMLKPLIKECIKEVIFEDGTLSSIISEVLKGTSTQPVITEHSQEKFDYKVAAGKRKKLLEQKRKMLDAIGKDAYNGIDLFEGTTPMSPPRGSSANPHGSGALDGMAPNDPGVDLSTFGISPNIMKKMMGK